MTTQPLVSIIVAVRNAEKTVARTLESILSQSYVNKEIILIDGVSSDSTLDIVETYKDRLSFFLSEPDRGIADAYNKGIARAHGEWIYFLNADDIFYSDTTLAECFACGPFDGDDLVVGKVVADNGRVFDGRYSWTLLLRNCVHHQAIFYRARPLKNSPYNAQYKRYGHDHEHNLLLWRRNARVRYIDCTIALWATGGVSDGGKWKDYAEEFRIRRNVMGITGWPFNAFTVLRYVIKRAIIFFRTTGKGT
jgi:putative colanic acid biosynthesis glycosyltransferase